MKNGPLQCEVAYEGLQTNASQLGVSFTFEG